MDILVILLIVVAIAALALGPIAFVMALVAREKLARAEARIAALEAERQPQAQAPAAQSAAMQAAVPAATRSAPATPRAKATRTPPARRDLEETLGARWSVIVGGVALALGSLLLVRYSIEQGAFGPAMRVALGLALAAALIGAGEFMRRRERATRAAASGGEGPNIPAILTAAGTIAAFGSIYAAHALYGFVGPTVAFVTLAAAGVACMIASGLHGPALAALGLVGALGALALAFVFALEGATLTVALALSALGSAYVSARLGIPALRCASPASAAPDDAPNPARHGISEARIGDEDLGRREARSRHPDL